MSSSVPPAILDPLLAAAEEAARVRADVDRETALEVMGEAATLLHNSLALDDLDEHDLAVVVAALSRALVETDPAAAVRALATAVTDDDPALHDAAAVRDAYVLSATALQL